MSAEKSLVDVMCERYNCEKVPFMEAVPVKMVYSSESLKALERYLYENISPGITLKSEETEKKTEDTKPYDKPVEKWIWVEGYKGTDKNLQGHGNYQFEVGKRYDMPTDAKIVDCHSGFHLSLNMKDVFNHYPIGNGNRFFKVKALVREKDFNEYGKDLGKKSWFGPDIRTKLASQSIEFIRELTVEEIFQDTDWKDWSEEYKKLAIADNIVTVEYMVQADELVTLGFSTPFAMYIVRSDKFDKAKAIASQPNLSMDMKAYLIMK